MNWITYIKNHFNQKQSAEVFYSIESDSIFVLYELSDRTGPVSLLKYAEGTSPWSEQITELMSNLSEDENYVFIGEL